ncbi:histidine kinase [Methylosinus sp. R-45379]|uniref:sensor histidine kinase n=1 Tax=Methylosinus sp. R-45379 TaxID=980563 RepID=UPI0007C91701|nr:sensor histidine kinase [Methylosinus sp. R-45379]OAI25288.1 histidine kinase [Methylosinus sp. R-45379]
MTEIDGRSEASAPQRRDDRDEALALERMRMALDASLTGIWDWDLVTGEVHLDARVRALWALPDDAPGSFEIFRNAMHKDDKHKDDKAQTREAVQAALDPGELGDYEAEYRVIGQTDGVERWIAVRGRTFFEGGRAARIIGTARDITDRKRREDHVHVLLRELVHRSKNLLAVVQAMARQTAAGAPSLADFQRKFAARLQALSMAHDLLVSQDWRGASMVELARAQLSYCLDVGCVEEQTRAGGPDLMLKPEAAQNIGLALHELSVNALTHGSLAQPDGRIELHWRLEDGRFVVEWREFGGPVVSEAPSEGFGHKVIKRLVAQALGGEATIGFPPDGFEWTLAVPAAQALAQ